MNIVPNRIGRILAILLSVLVLAPAQAQQQVRIATYNIKFLKASISDARAASIRHVIETLDADIIGLQEIADRAALQRVFDPAAWDIIIDDDSGDAQDVALVVRRPLRVLGMSSDLDADDEHFLFSGPENESSFPNRRDLLCVQVEIPGEVQPLFVMVHHAKSRLGGRAATDPRREAAALAILSKLEHDFDGRRFAIVGDCNDNPDDRSMNILEAGQPAAAGGPEEIQGPFLLNLCEPLVALDHVSWGLRASDVVDGRIDTVRPGSRQKNNSERGTAGHVSPILFDQILIPVSMGPLCMSGSARVFDDPAAILGGADAASDHLPVYADLVFPGPPEPEPPPVAGVVISRLLPDPQGDDRGREEVELRNSGAAAVNLDGWRLRDRAGNEFSLGGQLRVGEIMTFVLPAGELPLNNGGDEVSLLDAQGTIVHHVSYTAAQVRSGASVVFP